MHHHIQRNRTPSCYRSTLAFPDFWPVLSNVKCITPAYRPSGSSRNHFIVNEGGNAAASFY